MGPRQGAREEEEEEEEEEDEDIWERRAHKNQPLLTPHYNNKEHQTFTLQLICNLRSRVAVCHRCRSEHYLFQPPQLSGSHHLKLMRSFLQPYLDLPACLEPSSWSRPAHKQAGKEELFKAQLQH